jgi:excisionase family DNA binding protein
MLHVKETKITNENFYEVLTALFQKEGLIDFGTNLKGFQPPKDQTKYLTRGQVAKILQISLPTLHQYTKNGIINSYRIGVKVRYKSEDVENALTERNFCRKGGNHGA